MTAIHKEIQQNDTSAAPESIPIMVEALETDHKIMVNKVILPIMSIMTVILVLTHFSTEPSSLIATACCILGAPFNIFLSTKNRKFNFGRWIFSSRSDTGDAIRWSINFLVFDLTIFWGYHVGALGTFAGFAILIIAAMSETYARSHRAFVVFVGYLVFTYLNWRTTGIFDLKSYAYSQICMGLIIASVWVIESFWNRELVAHKEALEREVVTLAAIEQYRNEALVGNQVQTISHELNNLIFILDIHQKSLELNLSQNSEMDKSLNGMRLVIEKISGINRLVMDDFRNKSQTREISFKDLKNDIEILLKKFIRQFGIEFNLYLQDEISQRIFTERVGSTYLIIHNIAKNACEAIPVDAIKRSISIEIRANESSDRIAEIIVRDTGVGMPPEVVAAISRGESRSWNKQLGHGFGMRFVKTECTKNNFQLSITSIMGVGTTFTIGIPLNPLS